MKSPKPPAPKLETLSIAELNELWPKTDDGRLCARLLQRYGFTLLVESAVGASCLAERAQAESGAVKAIAKIVKDFGTVAVAKPPAPQKQPMRQLHRFATSQPEKPEKNDPQKK